MVDYYSGGQKVAGAGIWGDSPPPGVTTTAPGLTPPGSGGTPASTAELDAWKKANGFAPSGVSTASLLARAGITPAGTPTDMVFGSDLAMQMFQNLLMARDQQLRGRQLDMQGVDQTVSIVRLISDLERTSPVTAANFAANMGLPGQVDLDWVNNIDKGALAKVSGKAGKQDISLPLSLTGKSLAFLSQNPNMGNVVGDVADAIGLPDIFSRSAAAAIPTSKILAALG